MQSKEGGGDEHMHLRHRPFQLQVASPNTAWPGLHQTPLEAAMERLLTPYCPGSCQGDSKQNNNVKCSNFVGCFDGRGGATVVYRTNCPMEEIHGFPTKSH